MNISDIANKGKVTYSAKHPFWASVKEIYLLNKPGSTKENLHVVLDLSDSGITYAVGSSVGLYPKNAPKYVDKILSILGITGEEKFFHERSEKVLNYYEFFASYANLAKVTLSQIKEIYAKTQNKELEAILADREKRKAFIEMHNLASFLKDFWSCELPLELFCNAAAPMLPRFYSIASSMKVVGAEVHLMVASFHYEEAGEKKQSITTNYLLHHCNTENKIAMFVQHNQTFSLPETTKTPVIMIGPGTGMAAFRGFIQERFARDPNSLNWLFTGDRESAFDFHYEEELVEFATTKFLKLDLAFSRDSHKKVYVQDKMWHSRNALWHWINQLEAKIYISGDAKKMAKDVQAMLEQIFITAGNLSAEEAKDFLKKLKKEKRLLLDVY